MSAFPLDDATLVMLAEACRINPDLGRTTLHDFLDMGSRISRVEDQADGTSYATIEDAQEGTDDEVPVFFVEHEAGFEPFGEHEVIIALVEEIQRSRVLRDDELERERARADRAEAALRCIEDALDPEKGAIAPANAHYTARAALFAGSGGLDAEVAQNARAGVGSDFDSGGGGSEPPSASSAAGSGGRETT